MNPKTYRFVGYEVETGSAVIDWPAVGPSRRFHRGDVIEDGSAQWEVVGIRNTSTEELWQVDLRRVVGPNAG
jgi:hypothetical protein